MDCSSLSDPELRRLSYPLRPLAGATRALSAAALVFLVPAAAAAAQHQQPSFTVDGVHVFGAAVHVRGLELNAAPGDATQETTIVDRAHGRTLSVIAVPFGTQPATEDAVPDAQRGGARAYRTALHDYRVRTGQYAADAPNATLFGANVGGDLSQRTEYVSEDGGRSINRVVFTAEWVAEAGPRIWIVRETQEVAPSHALIAIADFTSSVQGLVLWSDGSLHRSAPSSGDADAGASPAAQATDGLERSLRKPPAYADACDVAHYDASAPNNWRHLLGTVYDGVPACGPRPALDGVPVTASFFPGAAVTVTQFDSTELSLRWMYLTYGTVPYEGNGDRLYANYTEAAGGTELYRYPNLARLHEAPRPGDVISYDTGGTGGHTAVVTSTHIDTAGGGWVGVMEQDGAYSGFARLPVVGGRVYSNLGGPVLGWLSPHRPE
jgi:hypothetical protein